ncbi:MULTISPECIES: deoxynucleoside kinase [unclassified Aureispira]|uniref:deoxynucleoside kinase n=1 Tax=unclassified Aureispira TaxID=2649989 RepID=UPI00069840F2|nr:MULTISPECIES: deoxynucleoside kinase [unclassified Aureispira]WMX12468.1 deoxynucleoside kinase [Aureispira sp. CCB-E]
MTKSTLKVRNGNYIVVEGNIGAGKTSLSKLLSEDLNARLILEEFSDNPFLPLFYKNPDRYAFPVELFFMTERHKQLQDLLMKGNLFQEYVVSDYIFSKTLLFAGQNLVNEELRLFQRLFHTLNASFPKPHLLVYLHRSVDDLLANISKRGRAYEQDISANYLLKIQQAYFDFFRLVEHDLSILIMDVEGLDFINNVSHYQIVVDQLEKEYPKGLHHWSYQQ